VCAQPYDQTPPCPPTLEATGDCIAPYVDLVWSNANAPCANDITQYHLYYAPTAESPFQLIATLNSKQDTNWTYIPEVAPYSIAGCFAVTALDSLNLWPDGTYNQNESAFSNIICIDNCPAYSLPNVITPNGDALNDLLVPIENRFVQDIDLKIFNRWGGLVYETTDASIQWNGKHRDSGELLTAGTYYYVIQVNTIRLEGIVPLEWSGHITILDSTQAGDTKQ
jgi:gliding motility-associated-like protein